MERRPRRRALLAVALTLGVVMGAVGCGSDAPSTAEQDKADQLHAKLLPLGLDEETDTIVALYGDDGGKVCELAANPGAMAREGLLTHPRYALRKLHVTTDAVAYTKAVIEVYCPDQLGNVEDYIEGLRVDDEN